jgi:hypothetical protein
LEPRQQASFAFSDNTAYEAIRPHQETVMAMLSIRNLDPAIKERLRVRAA